MLLGLDLQRLKMRYQDVHDRPFISQMLSLQHRTAQDYLSAIPYCTGFLEWMSVLKGFLEVM